MNWLRDQHGLTLAGQDLDVQARSLWAHGDFRYQQNTDTHPQLDIPPGSTLLTRAMHGAISQRR